MYRMDRGLEVLVGRLRTKVGRCGHDAYSDADDFGAGCDFYFADEADESKEMIRKLKQNISLWDYLKEPNGCKK